MFLEVLFVFFLVLSSSLEFSHVLFSKFDLGFCLENFLEFSAGFCLPGNLGFPDCSRSLTPGVCSGLRSCRYLQQELLCGVS